MHCKVLYDANNIFYFNSAKIFEEEDFEPRDYNYFLKPDCNNSRICFMLKEIEDELMKKSKSGIDSSDEIQGVISRLKFLRLYLQALTTLWPKSTSPNEGEMGEIQRLLSNAIDLMPIIKKTISKGTQPLPNGTIF